MKHMRFLAGVAFLATTLTASAAAIATPDTEPSDVLEVNTVHQGDQGMDTYVLNAGPDIVAVNPAEGEDHVTSIHLQWAYLGGAPEGTTYTVSFGSNPNLMIVNFLTTTPELTLGDVGAGLTNFDRTYYWRVTASDGAQSDLLSFDTETRKPQFSRLEGTAQPASRAAMTGDPVTLKSAAVSYVPSDITYQWFKSLDGQDRAVAGATDPNLIFDPATIDDEGQYYCRAENAAGSVQSDTAMIDIQAGLIHRYTFNDRDVTEVDGRTVLLDVVGGADGTLINTTGAAVVAHGMLTFGNDGSQNANAGGTFEADGDFVDLPNGLISSLGAVTLEAWFTWNDEAMEHGAQVYSFGMSTQDEGKSDRGTSYLMVTAHADALGGTLCGETKHNSVDGVGIYPHTPGPAPLHQEILVTWIHDDLAGLDKMYVNGWPQAVQKTGTRLSEIDDRNNWLGRAQWSAPLWVGRFNEFRIHDTALSAEEVLTDFLAGPDELGAYEAAPCEETMVGDTNGDCLIDLLDAAAMIEQWLTDKMGAEERFSLSTP